MAIRFPPFSGDDVCMVDLLFAEIPVWR